MKDKSKFIFLVLLVAGFLYGLYALLSAAFRSDVYPDYSTKRSARLGTRAFFYSLGRSNSLDVRQNFRPISELNNGNRETIYMLGMLVSQKEFLDHSLFYELLGDGDRLVIGFTGARAGLPKFERTATVSGGSGASEGSNSKSFSLDLRIANRSSDPVLRWARRSGTQSNLPGRIPARTPVTFKAGPGWKVLYRINDEPVVLERTISNGTVVVTGTSYPFSNFALRDHRSPDFLTWTIGGNRSVVFDETHLGVESRRGVMNLARGYGLHLFFLFLLVLGGLFVWKNTVPLVPEYEESTGETREDRISGRDAPSGMANLIKSRIPRDKILETCYREFEEDVRKNWIQTEHFDEIERLALKSLDSSGAETNLVRRYQKICDIVTHRRPSNG